MITSKDFLELSSEKEEEEARDYEGERIGSILSASAAHHHHHHFDDEAEYSKGLAIH